jgi:alkyl hydroperoxide reductase subunit AhpC
MTLRLNDIAPDFTAESTSGRIEFHRHLGTSWGVLFSHPRDFTPVCTTELGRVAQLAPEFQRRDVKVLGLSVDPLEDHRRWAGDIAETQGVGLNFPLIADPDRRVAELYGMIHPKELETLTVRSVFVIDPQKRIRLTITYPASTGRNFDELLRVIDSLQATSRHPIATPADWRPGQDVIISPKLDEAEAKRRFPGGFRTLKPYLRYVRQPD